MLIQKIFSALSAILVDNGRNCDEMPPHYRFYLISGKRGLRWVIPEDPNVGLPVLTYWRPYDFASRLKWHAIITGYRMGLLGRVPGITTICVVRKDDWAGSGIFSDHCGGSSPPVIYVGTPGSCRKAVAIWRGTKYSTLGCVLKIPLGKLAKGKIIHEASTLKQLVDKDISPKLLFEDAQAGIAGQQFTEGSLTGRRLTSNHIKWLIGLQDGGTTSIETHCELLRKRISNASGLGATEKEWVNTLIERIADPSPLPSVWLHGDFAPWNLKWNRKGIQAIDWEDSRKHALPLLDLIHFFVIQAFLFGDKRNFVESYLKNSLTVHFCRQLDLSPEVSSKLMLFYLVTMWFERVQNQEAVHAQFLWDMMQRIMEAQR